MSTEQKDVFFQSVGSQERCPVDHGALSRQKTARVVEPVGVPIERDANGVWHVRGFEEARTVLRSSETKQAGFKAELLERLPHRMQPPILYQEGKPHNQQRKQTARFFTPKVVSENYRQLMEKMADTLISTLQRRKKADLSQLSLRLAVRVAGQVVGLTNSRLPGMAKRLDAFFSDNTVDLHLSPRTLLHFVWNQSHMALFFLLDVKPAIEARKRAPQEDVISHLLERGATDSEILTECVTYAAAGMVTTREFISVAAWHLLEHPALRERYLVAPEAERYAMLHEILRLEPVVGHLYRRATADMRIESDGAEVVIPQGALIDIHIYGTNADESIVGAHRLAVCPERELNGDRVNLPLMSFGDGAHRCPGSYIAVQETDILLQRLLMLDGLRMEQAPAMHWNDLVTGYELRKFVIALA